MSTATSTSNVIKDLGNTLYKSTLYAIAIAGSRSLTKQIGMKDRPIEFKMKSIGMLALDTGVGVAVVSELTKRNIIPDEIFK